MSSFNDGLQCRNVKQVNLSLPTLFWAMVFHYSNRNPKTEAISRKSEKKVDTPSNKQETQQMQELEFERSNWKEPRMA